LCLPSHPRLPRPVFLASRGGSAPLLTPRFPRRLLPCRLSTWTCGAQPVSLDRAASATFYWLLTTTRGTPWSSPCAARVRGGEFSSDLLRDFCRGEGILQSFTLLDSPQQNGIAESRIGLVMDVARTSMIHVAAPYFLWPFAVRYTAHQLNLWPRVSFTETSPTLRWMGKVGDASVFRFYHPTSRHVFPSQDVTFDESFTFYHLFPYSSAPPPPPQLFLAPSPPPVDPLPPTGSCSLRCVSGRPSPRTAPVEVAIGSGVVRVAASWGAASGGAEPGVAESEGAGSGGAEPGGEELGGAEPEGVEPGGAESEGVESGGAEPRGATSSGGPAASALPAPSPYTEQSGGLTELREPASHPASHVCSARCVPRSHPPPVPDTHTMTLRPYSVPLCVPLPPPAESSLPEVLDPKGDRARVASPNVSRLLTTDVSDPSFEFAVASALVAELLDFAAACRLDYATALVAEFESASPPPIGGECALGTDVLEDKQEDFECLAAAVPRFASMLLAPEGDPDAPDIPTPRSYAEAITGPYSSQWQVAMDAEMASWKSTGTYVDEVPPLGANIVNGMWIFRVRERYFLLVVDDYTRYTTDFPLRSKGEVPDVLIPWIHVARLQLRERFRQDLPVLRLHFDRGGEFSSDLLWDFCRGEGILQSFTLPASPQQNGIAERRIGLVMEVARTSMIHAAAPHFLWSFAFRYTAHQLKLWPRVSLPETSPTLCWTGKVGNASMFRDVMFDEKVPFYHLFPYRSSPLPPPLLFLAPCPPPLDPLPPQGPGPSGVSQVDPLPGTMPVEVAVDSGAARGAVFGGAEPARAEPGGAKPAVAEPGGADSEGARSGGAEPWGAEPTGAEPAGAEPGGAESAGAEPGGPPGALSWREPLSPPQLREWFARRTRLWSGAAGAGGAVGVGGGGNGAGAAGATGAAGPEGARTGGTVAAGAGGAAGVRAVGTGAGAAGGSGAAGPRGACLGGTGAAGAGGAAGIRAGDPGAGDTGAGGADPLGAERREPVSPLVSPICAVRIGRRVPRPRPPPVPGTHHMALRPSSVPLRVPLPSPPVSSLPDVPDPESDLVRAASPTVPRLLDSVATDPSFESAAVFALVAELVDFAATCRLHYADSLVAESESDYPPSIGGECALGTDVLECFAAAVPHLVSMLIAPEGDPDAPDISTPRSYIEAITGTYVDAVPPPGANIADGMWIFRVKRPSGSPPAFKARYVARGFSQRQGGSLHEEIWLRRPPGFTGSFPAGTQWSLRRPVHGLRQAPRDWHNTLRTTLAALGFAPSTADPSLLLRTDTLLPPLCILVYVLQRFGFTYSLPESTPLPTGHLLSAPPSDESVELSGPYPELVGYLMYLMTCTRPDLAYLLSILACYVAPRRYRPEQWEAAKRVLHYLCSTSGMGLLLGGRGPVVLTKHADASWVDDLATQRSSQGYTFSLGSGSVSWRSTLSSSVLISSCEAEIYAWAMAAQKLRGLTYLLTDLREQPRSSPQRGQLRLAYVVTRANTADIFTKALPPGDHQQSLTKFQVQQLAYIAKARYCRLQISYVPESDAERVKIN
ncbi:unnamed protein product, partial [Closterium sp. NIES-53]